MSGNKNKQKVAIISGAAGYLGREVVRQLSKRGYDLALLYHSNPPAQVRSTDRVYQCDFADPVQIKQAVGQAHRDLSSINVAVHCAEPRILRGKMEKLTESEIKQNLETSILGAVAFWQSVARVMSKDGHVFGITSAILDQPDSPVSPYWIAKMAQRDYLNSLRKEVGSKISVHEIVPGFMAGGLNSDLPAVARELAVQRGYKVSTPEAVAQEIVAKISR